MQIVSHKTKLQLCVASILSLFLSACEQSSETKINDNCFYKLKKSSGFLGSTDCIAKFKREKFIGYWSVGFEYSMFFYKKEDAIRYRESKSFALNFLHDPDPEISNIMSSPRITTYKVSFIGSKSDLPGIYARGYDKVQGGVVVTNNFTLKGPLIDARPRF
jgi:hypothetical protein